MFGSSYSKIRLLLLKWCLIGCLLPNIAHATHIVGAELYYECLNPQTNRYRVTVRMLRDCLTGQAPFDDQINLFIFPVLNPGASRIETIPKPSSTPEIIPEEWDSCVASLYNLCVEEGIYQGIINLPARAGGYYIGWARCCRNQNITNLAVPLDQGVTFLAHVPGPEVAVCNSMPYFNQQMPIFICTDQDFFFDHSATDLDGDSLVYSLENAFGGENIQGLGAGNQNAGSNSPIVGPGNAMGPPPYLNVNYNIGFSGVSPFGLAGTATIDPSTGYLHFNPPVPGVYVVAISVREYRNGVLLSENKRDFQIHAINCRPLNPPPIIAHDLTGVPHSNDTIIVDARSPFCYRVTVSDTVPTDRLVALPISAVFGNANPFPPSPTVTLSGRNPLQVDICWTPACEYVGQTLDLIISGRDVHDCPSYNIVFDTVHVRILPPPPAIPAIGRNLSSVRFNGDTIIAGVDTTFCFDWWVVDTTGSPGSLSFTYAVTPLDGGPPINIGWNGQPQQDSLPVRVCWRPTCDSRGHIYRLVLQGNDNGACPPNDFALDTLFLRIPDLQNPPPVIYHDLSGNPLSADTILIEVHDTACYSVTLNDTFPGILSYQAFVQALDGLGGLGPNVVVSEIQSQDSLVLQICWTPVCDNIDRVFMLVVEGTQDNKCGLFQSVFDTTYIRVLNVFNPPPSVSHSFLPGYEVLGDTIRIAADSAACYAFSLRDPVQPTHLEFEFISELMPSGAATPHAFQINLTTQTDTLIAGEVCITPDCAFLDQTLRIVLIGRDTFDCSQSNIVFDTVYLDVVEPYNQPPAIQHSLNGLPLGTNGEVVVVPQAEEYCYSLQLSDPDSIAAQLTASGNSWIFNPQFNYGNPAELTYSGSNPLNIEVCWKPSCYDSDSVFALVVCGKDTSRCDLLPPVCDTVFFRVEPCDANLQNVFTPNNDGINDEFIPFGLQGVEYFYLIIYDRWGNLVFEGKNQAWDGKINGRQAPEGVYYYRAEYQFFSARGVPLKHTKVAWVTLLR